MKKFEKVTAELEKVFTNSRPRFMSAVYNFAGPSNIEFRMDYIEHLTGKKPTKRNAGVRVIEKLLIDKFSQPAPKVDLKITEREYAVLEGIFVNDFNTEQEADYPVWTEIVQECGYEGKVFSGLVSSLVDKKMICSDGKGKEATMYATDLGKQAYEAFKSNLKKEEIEAPAPAPAPKKEKAPKKAETDKPTKSPYGQAVEFMAADPDHSFTGLMTKMSDAGYDVDASKAAIRTAHSQAKKIIGLLIANGWSK